MARPDEHATRRPPAGPARVGRGALVVAALLAPAIDAAADARATSYRDYVCDPHDAKFSAPRCQDERAGEARFAFQLFMGLVWLESAPFVQPYLAGEADYHLPFFAGWSLRPYPYAGGADGYAAPVAGRADGPDPADAVAADQRRTLAVQLAVEGMPTGGGRVQARAAVLTGARVDLDLAYARYFDRAIAGAGAGAGAGAPGDAAATLAALHAAFRLGQTEHTQFRAGVGARAWSSPQGTRAGVDGLYAVDLFWPRPIVTSLELTGGSLGPGGALGVRGTVGAMVRDVELYAGYDATWLFGVDGARATYLGGPVAGARLYF